MPGKIPNTEDFQNALDEIFNKYEGEGKTFIVVQTGGLHRQVGGYPGENHRMPLCCEVMRKNMKPELGDEILPDGPAKGDGASLRIRYNLPRTSSKSFTTPCSYCGGTGKDPDPLSMTLQVAPVCPACRGSGSMKLEGSRDEYEPHKFCEGSGKDPDDIVRWKPCHICNGTGLVKVR